MSASFGDVAKALEICKWIYDNYFDKVGTADVKYKNLKSDIEGIYDTLKKLRTLVESASRPAAHIPGSWELTPQLQDSEIFAACDALIEPLEALKDIIKCKVECVKNGEGFIQSVIWALTTQGEVETHVGRLHFHMQKILLVIEPRKLDILFNLEPGMEEILYYLRPQPDIVLEIIPAWMDGKFLEALSVNPPKSYTKIGQAPLLEGLDACLRLYKQSTVLYVTGGVDRVPTIQQYLNLRKCHWLISNLKQGAEYQSTPQGSMNRRAIRQIEILLHNQYQRKITFADDDLRARDKSSFAIWLVPNTVTPPPEPPEAGFQEDKVLDISLPTEYPVQAHGVAVFQTGAICFRIMETKLQTDSMRGAVTIPKDIHLHYDRLIPWYASHPNSSFGIGFYNGTHKSNIVYRLKSEEDVLEFQRTFTGYRVFADCAGVQWAFVSQKHRVWSKTSRGIGRVQLWKWDPPRPPPRATPSQRGGPRSQSQNSAGAMDVVATLLHGQGSHRVNSIHHGSRPIVAISKPIPPVLLIYTRTKDTQDYTFLHISLSTGIRVVPGDCDCQRNPQGCTRIVLKKKEGSSESTFAIRQLSVQEGQANAWNLSVFSGYHPRHPQYLNGKGIEVRRATFLTLDFPSAAERMAFGTRVTEVTTEQSAAAGGNRREVKRMETFCENPDALSLRSSGSRTVTASLSSDETLRIDRTAKSSPAPEIDSISLSPTFSPSAVWGRKQAYD